MLYGIFVVRLVTCLRLLFGAVLSVQPAALMALATPLSFGVPPPPASAIAAITAISATMPDALKIISILRRRRSSSERPVVDERFCGAWTGRRGGGGVRDFFAKTRPN